MTPKTEFIPPGDKGWLNKNTAGGKLTAVTRGGSGDVMIEKMAVDATGGLYDREIAGKCGWFGFVETFDYCFHMGCDGCGLMNQENDNKDLTRIENLNIGQLAEEVIEDDEINDRIIQRHQPKEKPPRRRLARHRR